MDSWFILGVVMENTNLLESNVSILATALQKRAEADRDRFRYYAVRDTSIHATDLSRVIYHAGEQNGNRGRYNLDLVVEGSPADHTEFYALTRTEGKPVQDLVWNFIVQSVGEDRAGREAKLAEFHRYIRGYVRSFNDYTPMSFEPFDEAFAQEIAARYDKPGLRKEELVGYQLRALPQHMGHVRGEIRAVLRNTDRNIIGDYVRATLESGETTAPMRAGQPVSFYFGDEHRQLAKVLVTDERQVA
jgi:hypothetical protein